MEHLRSGKPTQFVDRHGQSWTYLPENSTCPMPAEPLDLGAFERQPGDIVNVPVPPKVRGDRLGNIAFRYEGRRSVTHEETCGKDVLEEIYDDRVSSQEAVVVRWCPVCGAIVVDLDVDGRTFPGRISPIRFPRSVGK